MGFFDGMLPPEIQEQLREQRDKDQMVRESLRREIEGMFLELSPENLATLRLILRAIADEPSGRLAAYYEGIVAQTLVLKYNLCGGCGGDHGDNPESILEAHNESDDKPEKDSVEDDAFSHPAPDGTGSIFEPRDEQTEEFDHIHPEVEHIGHTGLIHPDTQAKMNALNLDDLREEGTNRILGFVCKGCGLKYVSVEDRAIREECHGCLHKAAWG